MNAQWAQELGFRYVEKGMDDCEIELRSELNQLSW